MLLILLKFHLNEDGVLRLLKGHLSLEQIFRQVDMRCGLGLLIVQEGNI